MKKIVMKKSTLIAVIIILVTAIAFAVALPLYLKSKEGLTENYIAEKIVFKNNGVSVGEYTVYELLEKCPSREFSAIYKPSGMSAKTNVYTGIPLKELLAALGISLSGKTGVRFTAFDGRQIFYSVGDVVQENNVYIAFKVNGKNFKRGIDTLNYKNAEDGGPFVVIKAKDSISQNRVRMLVEVEIL